MQETDAFVPHQKINASRDESRECVVVRSDNGEAGEPAVDRPDPPSVACFAVE